MSRPPSRLPARPGTDWQALRRRLDEVARQLDQPDRDALRRDRVLKERARIAAQEPPPEAAQPPRAVVEFSMGQERYAIDLGWVREVLALRELTPLPGTPAFVAGIVNVRGRVVAVLDLKAFFELPAKGLPDLDRVLVIGDDAVEFALLADAVHGVRMLPTADIQAPPATLTGVRARYLAGVTAAGLAVLDGARIVGDPRLMVHDEVPM